MTYEQAELLSRNDPTYRPRKLHGKWVVWCDASDHVVEFDQVAENAAAEIIAASPIFKFRGPGLITWKGAAARLERNVGALDGAHCFVVSQNGRFYPVAIYREEHRMNIPALCNAGIAVIN